MSKDYLLLHHAKMPRNCSDCSYKRAIDGRLYCIFSNAIVDDTESRICGNECCPLQKPQNHRETPTKAQLFEIAEKLFDEHQKRFGVPENVGKFKSCMETTQSYMISMAEIVVNYWEQIRSQE